MRSNISSGYELFDRYILAAEALKNRAQFGILAASEHLAQPCDIDRNTVKAELLKLRERYKEVYLKRLTPEHTRRTIKILFDTLLEYLQ